MSSGPPPPPPKLPPLNRGYSFCEEDYLPFPLCAGFAVEEEIEDYKNEILKEIESWVKKLEECQEDTRLKFQYILHSKICEPLEKEIKKFSEKQADESLLRNDKHLLERFLERMRKIQKELFELRIEKYDLQSVQLQKLSEIHSNDPMDVFEYKSFEEWAKKCDILPRYYTFVDNESLKREFNERISRERIKRVIEKNLNEMSDDEIRNEFSDLLPKNTDYKDLRNFFDSLEQKFDAVTKYKVEAKLYAKFGQKTEEELYEARILSKKEFCKMLRLFIENETSHILTSFCDDDDDDDNDKKTTGNLIQKLVVSEDSQIYVMADIHGDVRSVVEFIRYLTQKKMMDGFKIVSPNTYIIFLGDYIDRGAYSSEVLYTIGRLKIENPSHVICIKGNHDKLSKEHFSHEMVSKYGFADSSLEWANGSTPFAKQVEKMFDLFIKAVYLGNNEKEYILLCHAGIDYFDPKNLNLEKTTTIKTTTTKEEKKNFKIIKYYEFDRNSNIHQEFIKKLELKNEEFGKYAERTFFETSKFNIDPNKVNEFIYKDHLKYTFFSSEATNIFLKTSSSCCCCDYSEGGEEEEEDEEEVKILGFVRGHHHGSGMPEFTSHHFGVYNCFYYSSTTITEQEEKNKKKEKKNNNFKTVEECKKGKKFEFGDVWTLSIAPDSMNGKAFCYSNLTILKITNSTTYNNNTSEQKEEDCDSNKCEWILNPINIKILSDEELVDVMIKKMKAYEKRKKKSDDKQQLLQEKEEKGESLKIVFKKFQKKYNLDMKIYKEATKKYFGDDDNEEEEENEGEEEEEELDD